MIYIYKKDADQSVFALNQISGQVEETKESTVAPAAEFNLDPTYGDLSYDQDTAIREIEFIVNGRGYLTVESFMRAIAEKLQYSGIHLNIPFVTVTVKSSSPIAWEIGDYIIWDYDGNKYVLRELPSTTKQATIGTYGEAFIYEDVKFVSELSLTKNVSFLDVVLPENNVHFTALPTFSFYGKASDLIDRLNANLMRLYDNWLVKEADLGGTGEVYASMQEYYNVEIDNTDCWNALSLFSSLWKVGYSYYYDKSTSKHTIEVGATYNSTGDFAYGQGNGLKLIAKSITAEDAIITRLRAYGSDKNLPSRYYNNIMVDGNPLIDTMQYVPNLMIPFSKWGTTDGKPDVLKSYIDCNSADVDGDDTSFAKYGIREASIFFDGSNNREDIYPTIENITAGELRTAISQYAGSETYISPSIEYSDSERLDLIKVGDTIVDDGNIDSKTAYTEVVSYAGDSGIKEIGDIWDSSGEMEDSRTYKFTLDPIFSKALTKKGEYEARFAPQTLTVTCTDATIDAGIARLWLVKNGQNAYPAKEIAGTAIENGFSFSFTDFTFEVDATTDTFAISVDFELSLSGITSGTPVNIFWTLSSGELTYYFQKYIIENTFNITLKQVGFDIVKYAATTGQSAKISMKSGSCAGREFVIRKSVLDGDSWILTCVRQIDQSLNQWFPNSNFHIAAGDSFVLLDLSMAEVFIDIAENRLYSAACKELAIAKEQQYIYEPVIDNVYMALNPEVIKEGMMMPIVEPDLGINDSIIINSVTITENDGEVRKFEVVLRKTGDTELGSYVSSIAKEESLKMTRGIVNAETRKTQSTESFFNIYAVELARRNAIRQTQLEALLFDSEGYFDGNNIRPNSIETLHLSVGSKSTDFWLNKTRIEPNYQGNKSSFYVSAGELIHLRLQVAGLGHTWIIATPLSATGLIDETAYYLYAKCSKTALTGEWVLSSDQLPIEPSPADGYYYFLVGILFPVLESPTGVFARDYDFTYGMTYINGRIITTGRIRSIDGNNYFDLDQNKFRIGNTTSSLDWNVTSANTLTLKGAMVQSPSGATFPVGVFRGAYNAGTKYYQGDSVTYNGESWLYINATATTGMTPSEGYYWTKYASKGSGGAAVTLTPTKQVFYYDASGNLVDSGAWFLWATVFNVTGTIYYEWLKNDVQIENDIHSGLSIVPPNNISGMPVKYQVNIRVGSTSSPILATDVLTIYGVKPGADGEDGADGYTIVLTNEAHTIPAANDGTVLSFSGSGTDIVVFKGVTPIAYGTGANTFDVSATPTNVTPDSTPETIDTYTRRYGDITGMSADSGNISFTIKIRDVNSVETTITKVQSFSKSKAGAAGATVTITTTDQVFAYDSDGANPSPASCTITAYASGIIGTLYYQFCVNGVSKQNTTSNTYTYTPQANFDNMPEIIQVFVRSGITFGDALAQDMMTLFGVKAAKDGYTIILSNEAHTLPAASNGTVSSFAGSGTDINVFSGTTAVAYGTGANTFDVTVTPYNVTMGAASTVNTYTRRYADLTAMSADTGTATFTIKVRNADNVETVFTKIQSFSKSKAGADGEAGAKGDSPALVYRGVYSASATYYGTPTRVDAVKYNNSYWVAKTTAPNGSFSGQTPSEGAYWAAFGASFESVATGLLLAEKALIQNLAVEYYDGVYVSTGTLTGTVETVVPAGPGVKRKDKITLTAGTLGGVANVSCNGAYTQMFYHEDGLAATAESFVAAKANFFLTRNVTLTSDGAIVYFEHTIANTDFIPSTSISFATNPYRGSVSIVGNDIWADADNTDNSTVCINRKGYNGGFTKYRRLYIFDGKGGYLIRIEGNPYGGAINFHAASVIMNGDLFEAAGTQLYFPNMPTSPPLESGMLYSDDGVVKITP